MQILVLLVMYFDAVVVFVTSQTPLFRLAPAMLWLLSFGTFNSLLAGLVLNQVKSACCSAKMSHT